MIEYFRGSNYSFVPNIAIASRGPVLSVTLFSRVPLAEVRSVALDEGSRTSAALAQILLRKRYGIRPAVEALTLYGHRLGMTFQIVDDVLDVVATDEELGKPAGNDLLTGVYTLPVIRALAGVPDLRDLLGGPLDGDTMNRARDVVRSNGAVSAALSVATAYAAEAEDALRGFAQNQAVDALRALPSEFVEGVPA